MNKLKKTITLNVKRCHITGIILWYELLIPILYLQTGNMISVRQSFYNIWIKEIKFYGKLCNECKKIIPN